MGWPVSASQIRSVVSPAGDDAPPIGAKRHTDHPAPVAAGLAGVAGERAADLLAAARVPDPHHVVAGAVGDAPPVGAECRTPEPLAGVDGQRRAGGRVPLAQRAVGLFQGDDAQPVRAEPQEAARQARCHGRSGDWSADGFAGGGVPEPQGFVLNKTAAGDDARAVGAERHIIHRVGVAGQRVADRRAGGSVPYPHRLVLAAGDDAPCVRAKCHAIHRTGVTSERVADGLAGGGVPYPHRLVGRRRRCAARRG